MQNDDSELPRDRLHGLCINLLLSNVVLRGKGFVLFVILCTGCRCGIWLGIFRFSVVLLQL